MPGGGGALTDVFIQQHVDYTLSGSRLGDTLPALLELVWEQCGWVGTVGDKG